MVILGHTLLYLVGPSVPWIMWLGVLLMAFAGCMYMSFISIVQERIKLTSLGVGILSFTNFLGIGSGIPFLIGQLIPQEPNSLIYFNLSMITILTLLIYSFVPIDYFNNKNKCLK